RPWRGRSRACASRCPAPRRSPGRRCRSRRRCRISSPREERRPSGAESAVDKLEEAALLAARGLVLMQEGELAVFEGLEELLPGDRLQSVVGLGEIDAQDA